MYLESLEECQLAIGSYPFFKYDASNGGGRAYTTKEDKQGWQFFKFDKNKFSIPPLNWRTTKMLGIPLPPGLEITILVGDLEGRINKENGEILMDLRARFVLSVLSYYYFPELEVNTRLSTRKVESKLHDVEGIRICKNEYSTLVGTSIIQKTGNKLLDNFLGLPNEALAILKCKITNTNEN